MRRLLIAALVVVASCGPGASSDDDGDDDTGDPCSGDETRCQGNQYQVCSGGTFHTEESCPSACNADLGCVDCDPDDGNTCDGNSVVTCNADGTFGGTVEQCGNDMQCTQGMCSNACTADGVDLIYVVDNTNRFLSFDPRKLGTGMSPFTMIGTLSCPAGPPLTGWTAPATPFSMSVDRNGTAWVLYTSGQIFHVDITSAQCTASTFPALQAGWNLFGMGYSTDSPGADTEKLYIAGGPIMPAPNPMTGYIDPSTLMIQNTGSITAGENSPELTGTGDAALFGYFPGTTGNGFVQQITKTNPAMVTGTAMQAGPVPGGPAAWAFAHWGGKFYIFVTDNGLPQNSMVQVVDRASGSYDGIVLEDLPYLIVGAGVSTCAPVIVE